ncbi:MAG: endonuclease NucS [Nanoarchaeota archaeon]|nr:endonuclease NucS [Nanoarchaeota archaeon]MBU1031249.1 endonuclease NucS [Nanoarchaeota archaeon]MBU1849590.1 endonuclease NucS [Nanoarchaeota archaeon]
MELGVFEDKFEESYKRNEFITFFCKCKIVYSGRAEASLGKGDRLVSVKQDGTIFVHQPEGGNPINYMKSGGSIVIIKQDYGVLFKAHNSATREYLELEISRVYEFMARKLDDGQKQIIAGTEADMSDMIKDNPSLINDDFKPLSREEHTKFGFIDVFGHDKKGTLVVVECKRYVAGLDAVQQLRRYVEKIKELKGTDKVSGILASPKISPNAEAMLKNWGFSWKLVNPPMRLIRHNKTQKALDAFLS